MTRRHAVLNWLAAFTLGGVGFHLLVAAPFLIVCAALVPAACYVALLIFVDRGEHPVAMLLTALIWGAVAAAPLASILNGLAQEWLMGVTNVVWLSPLLAAPVIEEGVKVCGFVVLLLIWRQRFTGVIDGIVYGVLIGIGFTVTENIAYFVLAAVQGGEQGLARSVYLRAVLEGLNHASFTALAGAGVGYMWMLRSTRWRIVAVGLGFGAAVFQHALWNAVAAQMVNAIVCNPAIVGGPCSAAPPAVGLFIKIPLVIAACIGPGVVTVALIAAEERRRSTPRSPS